MLGRQFENPTIEDQLYGRLALMTECFEFHLLLISGGGPPIVSSADLKPDDE
jgi:hypothetical protein